MNEQMNEQMNEWMNEWMKWSKTGLLDFIIILIKVLFIVNQTAHQLFSFSCAVV